MKIKVFSTSFMAVQEKYERFATFEDELNEFVSKVDVIDIKYSTSVGMCHDAQTHVNETFEDFSVLVMYNEKPKAAEDKTAAESSETPAEEKKSAAKKTSSKGKKTAAPAKKRGSSSKSAEPAAEDKE